MNQMVIAMSDISWIFDGIGTAIVTGLVCLSLKNVDSQNASKNVYKLLIPQRSILRQSD